MAKLQNNRDGSYPKIGIIGAGISGITMAIQIKTQLNIHDAIIFEGEDDIGGTWLKNTYPGAACDIQSHLYSSYRDLNPNWTRDFSGQEEILQYWLNLVDKYHIRENIQFNTWVKGAKFDKVSNKWMIKAQSGSSGDIRDYEVDILIGAVGALRIPNIPKVLSDFKGPWMHSAQWNHAIDLTNKIVGVVGTGASAVQIIPSIVGQVQELHTFQRSPPYVIPRWESTYSEFLRACLAHIPLLLTAYYWLFFMMNEIILYPIFYKNSFMSKLAVLLNKFWIQYFIKDPLKRELMLPKYSVGCKRATRSDDYYEAINRDNVIIHDGNIDRVDGCTLYLKDGTSQTIDVLILATGFITNSPYTQIDIKKLDGDHLDADLDHPTRIPLTNYGITYSGMPNFFTLYGPTTNLGHSSVVFMLECQASYIIKLTSKMVKYNISVVDLKPEVGKKYWTWVQTKMQSMSWSTNCNSWYQNKNGEVVSNWPSSCLEYYLYTLNPKLSDYNTTPRVQSTNS